MNSNQSLYEGEIVQPADMGKPTHLAISRNLPEHIREDYPHLVAFIEAYYRFVNTTHIGNLDTVKDIDTVSAEFLGAYRRQFAPTIPEFTHLQIREFIKHAKEFYTAKGTEESIAFLFKMLFAETITLEYPGENTLKASDGKWVQQHFVTVQPVSGSTVPVAPFELSFENGIGKFSINVTSVEDVGSNNYRFFYSETTKISVAADQLLYHTSSSGVVTFAGTCVLSPSNLFIENGGRDWMQGQIIRISGSVKDTIARVTRVSSIGAILSLEILEYGIGHTENQITLVSPYPTKPAASEVTIDRVLTGTSPTKYTYFLNIVDALEGFAETVRGMTENSAGYVLEAYVVQGYVGQQVIILIDTTPVSRIDSYSEITLRRWLDSRATIVFEYDTSVRTRGTYKNEDSLISNSNVFLQDNYFYQAYSYLIETEHDEKEFKSALALTHPAGVQWFSNFRKEFDWDSSNVITSRALSSDQLILSDQLNLSDSVSVT